ncbi:MAG TPA: hypothetical protein VNN80_35030, partial [Polyangiaceae bacterium]|nr:hypothetical protein [Polyangiaceae bacterium]
MRHISLPVLAAVIGLGCLESRENSPPLDSSDASTGSGGTASPAGGASSGGAAGVDDFLQDSAGAGGVPQAGAGGMGGSGAG